MKKLCLGIAAILALMATPGLAADMPVKAPAPPVVSPEYDWSGVYAGASVGWMRSTYDWRYTNPAVLFGFLAVGCCSFKSASVTDGLIGGHIGAQWQWSHIVVGVEFAANAPWWDVKANGGTCLDQSVPVICQVRPQAIEMLGGRLGYAWSNLLFYGDGGGARSSVVSNLNTGTLNPPVNNDYDSILSTHKGWYAGAGVEYVLMKGGVFDLIGGLEYQYIDLGTQTHMSSLFPAFSPCPPGNDCRAITAKDNLVRVRLTVKLNPFASPRP